MRRQTGLALGVVGVLSSPAVLSFGVHVVEHVYPLGVTRGGPCLPSLPKWLGLAVLWAAFNCTVPTWCAIVVALAAVTRPNIPWLTKALLLACAAVAYVAMDGIQAVIHSCWGEAPHVLWLEP